MEEEFRQYRKQYQNLTGRRAVNDFEVSLYMSDCLEKKRNEAEAKLKEATLMLSLFNIRYDERSGSYKIRNFVSQDIATQELKDEKRVYQYKQYYQKLFKEIVEVYKNQGMI